MVSRRDFLHAGLAAAALLGPGRGLAQRLTEDALLPSTTPGDVTIAHVADLHAQTKPVWFREPSVNLGVGAAAGAPPHLTGADFLAHYGLAPGSADAYALTSQDFATLAREFGRMGGLDRVATVVNRIRADAPEALVLDGGDTWQGGYVAMKTQGQDMVDAMTLLGVDAMTSHWEFTLGRDRVDEIVAGLPFPFLGANIFDAEWDEPAYEPYTLVQRGGVTVAVIGQAFPYMPIANPKWMFPGLSFGVREQRMRAVVAEVRAAGAAVVVLLSHNGFDVDRKLASRVEGIDVILCAHTHDALPEPLMVNGTALIASGSNGKFVSRLDIDATADGVTGLRHRLIPVFADVIAPDPAMAALIDASRAPHEAHMAEVLGVTESLLFRRGNVNGTMDDLILQALMAEREAEIALSPGFRWGPSLLPGDPIRREDVYNATAMSYPAAYRTTMTGRRLKTILEDVADNLFHPDPYYQQGGDMVRVGGMGYRIDVTAPMGSRISDMTHLASGAPIEAERAYSVAGWASVNEGTEGPPIWEVLEAHIRRTGVVRLERNDSVRVSGA